VVREQLELLVTGEQPQQVLSRVNDLRTQNLLATSELDRFSAAAVEELERSLDDAIDRGEHEQALISYWSLVASGQREPDPAFETQLYLGRARELLSSGAEPAALASLLQAPELGSLPLDSVNTALETALRLNNRAVAAELVPVLEELGQQPAASVLSFIEESEAPVDMLDGVVTIFVNRGLRLERGVGIPDRVIGSGFFVDPRGYIVTNYHVIESEVDPEYEGYSRLYVRLREDPDTRIPARVIGYSPIFDVALLKIEVDAPYVFSFSDTRELRPGSRIYAIGSPGGLENSISSGVISATGRRFLQMGDTMQIDVPINPGNSGGPLLDERGRLVGVVFAGIEQFEGVNFAIPAYWINRFLPSLYAERTVPHPWMGVAVSQERSGLEVMYVALGSPAAVAGLQVGDVLTHINGVSVDTVPEAHEQVLSRAADSLVSIQYEREGEERIALPVLAERPRRPVLEALDSDLRERLYPVLFGMEVERAGRDFFRPAYAVSRVYRGSTADEIGISEGDRFTELGFDLQSELQVVLLQVFIQKRTEGFVRTNLQLPAFVERDNFL
jgi:S1-C subfamily serine protease